LLIPPPAAADVTVDQLTPLDELGELDPQPAASTAASAVAPTSTSCDLDLM
jgi:hypothetical protein